MLGIIALVLAVFGLGLSLMAAILAAVAGKWAKQALTMEPSDEEVRNLERRVKAVEMEWNDAYVKLRRLAGRLDRQRGHDSSQEGEAQEPTPPPPVLEEPPEPDAKELWKIARSRGLS